MIDADRRKAVFVLHQDGMGIRAIARHLKISPTTVAAIISQKGQMPETVRADKLRIDPELLARLYHDCQGRAQRVYEKLNEEEGISIAYSTLTQILREHGIGKKGTARCHREADVPGAEMQHDTSPYRLRLGNRWTVVQASLLYFRYSKVRYLKFYRSFNRFKMKCFLHQALCFWGYAAGDCIIDNTNLARLRGTGKNAVIVPEMALFAERYNFRFVCHEKGHANRKAGNERGFYTVETNFLPGRSFDSLEDMNRQALEWATVRSANRPTGKMRLIPSIAFDYEKPYLTKLAPYIQPPYRVHERATDQYGYAAFNGNFYWIPGTRRHGVKVLEYDDHLKIYHTRKFLGRYELPADGVKNQLIAPQGGKRPPQKPNDYRKPAVREEKILRDMDERVNNYLSFALAQNGRARNRFLRALFALQQNTARSVFIQSVERARKYRITDIETIENIIVLKLRGDQGSFEQPDVDADFQKRPAYIEGCLTDEVDLSIYDAEDEDE